MKIEQRVSELIEEKIADRPDLFVVEVKMHPNGRLVVLVDGDKGITIEDCAAISRYVGYKMEEGEEIDHAWNLEVSSPGIDTPLKLLRQYKKNIDRSITVKDIHGVVHKGTLKEVSEQGIIIETKIKKEGEVKDAIPFDQISETKVLISFK